MNLPRHYSGNRSEQFWDIVNSLNDDGLELYSLCCKLQELEEEVLKEIDSRIEESERLHSKFAGE